MKVCMFVDSSRSHFFILMGRLNTEEILIQSSRLSLLKFRSSLFVHEPGGIPIYYDSVVPYDSLSQTLFEGRLGVTLGLIRGV